MNNAQFRNLILDKDKQQNGKATAQPGATPASLGTKRAGFIPMTPRTVKGSHDVDFARQVRERNTALQPTKKYKSAAPKGVKYGAGYTDRVRARAEAADGEDDKESRIKALEEQMKLGQISLEMFESLRDQITGGDISNTHLVKGLDRQLLERVRRGEDVLGTGSGNKEEGAPPDLDDELDKLGEKEIEIVKKEKAEKKGTMAPPALAGRKRTRDELMAELKAQRKAAAEAKAAPLLGGKWRKVGEEQRGRVEVDSKGREVLITVDEDGVVKRKVRKARPRAEADESATIAVPDAGKHVLGADMALPEASVMPAAPVEEEDDDIFEGVGTEYNPLGNDRDDSDSDASSDEHDGEAPISKQKSTLDTPDTQNTPPSEEVSPEEPLEKPRTTPRNYFGITTMTEEEESAVHRQAGIQDLLKKAAKMDPLKSPDDDENEAEKARRKRRAEMLAQQDRDLEDLDMGFGGGRLDDEGEEEGKKMRLSEWKGGEGEGDDGWEEGAGGKKGGKRKRQPKKRKGDVNSAKDIMRVIEGRKNAK